MSAPEVNGAGNMANWCVRGPEYLLDSLRYRNGIDPSSMRAVLDSQEATINGLADIASDLTETGLWGYQIYPSDETVQMRDDRRVADVVRAGVLLGAAIGLKMAEEGAEIPEDIQCLLDKVHIDEQPKLKIINRLTSGGRQVVKSKTEGGN